MYTGFNLKLKDKEILSLENEDYSIEEIALYNNMKEMVFENLEALINGKQVLDGDMLQQMWFPAEMFGRSDFIFISHSHKDEKLAISLAGYIKQHFDIQCFIDSCVWRNMYELNRILNKCDKVKNSRCHGCDCNEFSQNLGYVHMMLASALMTVIDKCECIFFLNTEESINSRGKTESPWIYYELNIADIVEKKRKEELFHKEKDKMHFLLEKVEFTPKLQEMARIDVNTILEWTYVHQRYAGNAFEELYSIVGKI